MKVSSGDTDLVVSLRSQLGDARGQLVRQRGALLSLEQELKKMMRLRGDVVRTLVLLNEERHGEARAKLAEVMQEWPST